MSRVVLDPIQPKAKNVLNSTSSEPTITEMPLEELPDIRPGKQEFTIFNISSGGSATKLEPLVRGNSKRIVLDDDSKLFIFELRKSMHGIGFKVKDIDGRPRISHVYSDHRAPVSRHQATEADYLLMERDIVIQVDETLVSSSIEVERELADAQLEKFVTIHFLREGMNKVRDDERRRQTEAVLAMNSPEANRKREEELRQLEQQRKLERQLAIRKLARSSFILQNFITECESRFTVPDIELMCRMQETFRIQGRRQSTLVAEQEENEVQVMDLANLNTIKPIHIFIMCEVIGKIKNISKELNVKAVDFDFGWRELDRLSLFAVANLVEKCCEIELAEGQRRKVFQVHTEGINTGLKINFDKPYLFGVPFLTTVGPVFSKICKLVDINLSKSNIPDTASDILLESVMSCSSGTLKTLDLSNNMLGKRFALKFGAALSSEEDNPCKQIESLSLAWNEMGTPGGIALFSALLDAKNVNLSDINVSFNGLTDDVVDPIRKLLESNTLPLSKLDLSHNRLQHRGGMELSVAIEATTTLTEFSVGFNKLGFDATVWVIAKAKSSETLEVLQIENTCGDFMAASKEGNKVICEGKEVNKFGDDAIQYLWDLKEHMNTIRCEKGSTQIEVSIEYPFKQRESLFELKWFHVPLGLLDDKEEEPKTNKLSLAASIFKDRCKESDSRAFFDTLDIVETAMKVDWQFLRPKLQRFIKKDVSQIDLIHAIVAKRYFTICNIFRFYAATGDEHDCLGFVEFLDLMNRCKVTDRFSCPETAAQGAFVAANVEIEAETKEEKNAMDENPDNAMCLYEFIEALVRLGLRKFMEKNSRRKAESESQATEWILDDHLIQHCEMMNSNCFRRDKIYFCDVVTTLETYKLKIDKVWREYAGSSGANLLMSVDQWKDFTIGTNIAKMTVCDSLRNNKPVTLFSPGALSHAFWAAHTMIKNILVRNVREKARNSNDMLTYTEFLEALVRLADSLEEVGVLMELGLPPDAFLSEKLVVLLEIILGAEPTNVFSQGKYPALVNTLRENHFQMEWQVRVDYIFEDQSQLKPMPENEALEDDNTEERNASDNAVISVDNTIGSNSDQVE